MIDKKELRLGNWVQNDAGVKWQFGSFGELSDYLEFEGESKLTEPFPIPLTIKILEQSGFKYTGYGYEFPGEWIFYLSFHSKGKFGVFFKRGEVSLDTKIIDEIKYFHEIQNVYYVLTEKELEINF